jgi:hypothetical protein
MNEQEKPVDISSVDPTFGRSDEEVAELKAAARRRHPAFNPEVHEELKKLKEEKTIKIDEFVNARSPQSRRRIIRGNVVNISLPETTEELDQETVLEPQREYNVPLGRFVDVVELPHKEVDSHSTGSNDDPAV